MCGGEGDSCLREGSLRSMMGSSYWEEGVLPGNPSLEVEA